MYCFPCQLHIFGELSGSTGELLRPELEPESSGELLVSSIDWWATKASWYLLTYATEIKVVNNNYNIFKQLYEGAIVLRVRTYYVVIISGIIIINLR